MAKSSRFILVIDADGKPARQEISKLTDSVKQADSEAKTFGKGGSFDGLIDDLGDVDLSVRGITSALTGKAGAGVAIAGLAGGLLAAAKSATEAAIEVDVLSTALDTDVETASRLATAFERVGVETNDIADIGLQISGALSDDVDMAARLGLTLRQANDPVTALRAGIDNWDFLTATERASVFGEEGVRQISAIIAQGGTLTELLNDVDEATVISEEDVARARELDLEIAKMEEGLKGAALVIGQEVIPLIGEAVSSLAEVREGPDESGWTSFGSSLFDLFTSTNVQLKPVIDSVKDLRDKLNSVTYEDLAALENKVWISTGGQKRAIDATAERWGAMADAAKAAIDGVDAELNESRNGALENWRNGLNIETETAKLQALIRTAMNGSVEDIHNAEQATIDWLGQLENVDEAAIVDLRAAFDDEDLAKVYADIDGIRQAASIPLTIPFQGLEFSNPGYNGPGDPAFWSAPAPATSNLTVNMPRSATPRSVGQQVDQWRRVNG
jgi:hypothetical protein